MTLREEAKARGLESDQWYCRGEDRELPDFAIEVVVTNPLIDKLDVHRGLGIREVWVYENETFRVLALRGDRYEASSASEVVPELALARLVQHLAEADQHASLKAFRDELRGTR